MYPDYAIRKRCESHEPTERLVPRNRNFQGLALTHTTLLRTVLQGLGLRVSHRTHEYLRTPDLPRILRIDYIKQPVAKPPWDDLTVSMDMVLLKCPSTSSQTTSVI